MPSSTNEALSRHAFGFTQVIVAATAFGMIFGIDSSNGEILWSRVLGLGWAAEIGGRIHPVKLYMMLRAQSAMAAIQKWFLLPRDELIM